MDLYPLLCDFEDVRVYTFVYILSVHLSTVYKTNHGAVLTWLLKILPIMLTFLFRLIAVCRSLEDYEAI